MHIQLILSRQIKKIELGNTMLLTLTNCYGLAITAVRNSHPRGHALLNYGQDYLPTNKCRNVYFSFRLAYFLLSCLQFTLLIAWVIINHVDGSTSPIQWCSCWANLFRFIVTLLLRKIATWIDGALVPEKISETIGVTHYANSFCRAQKMSHLLNQTWSLWRQFYKVSVLPLSKPAPSACLI